MGEWADSILDGEVCEKCGQYMEGPLVGFPVTCSGCKGEEGENNG